MYAKASVFVAPPGTCQRRGLIPGTLRLVIASLMTHYPYFEIQRAIFKPECDLSVFRLRLNLSGSSQAELLWHVVVLGQLPPEELSKKIDDILSTSVPATLPIEVLKVLQERRAQTIKQGPWIERHFRPDNRP